jgi:hypothetical protein
MIFLAETGRLLRVVINQFFSNFFSEAITLIILSIVLVVILIARSEKYFGFGRIVNYLSNKHLIITELVEISYFPLISDAFMFLVLFTLLGLLKNLLSFYETSKLTNRLRRS